MAYLDSIFGSQVNMMQRSLGKTAQRQSSLMNNLANVNVPGFKRSEVDFNVALEEEMEKPEDFHFTPKGANSTSNSSVRQDGNNVDMEHEMVAISATENHFAAMSELTSRYFSGLKSVIKEGR